MAGPETANNAAVQTSMIPMLTLGLPSKATMALMMGAMMLPGIVPGPRVIETNPRVFWGLICSMWIGNIMLLILNLPLVGIWVKLLRMPYAVLLPFILMISCIGLYTVNNSIFDIWTAAAFGFALFKPGFVPARCCWASSWAR